MTRPALVRRTLAGALVPLALAALTSCGGDPASGSASDSTSESAGASAPALADLPEEGASVDPADFTDLIAASFDTITTARTTVEAEMMGTMTGKGEVDYSGDSPAAAMTMTGSIMGGDEIEAILVDGAMYLDMGSLTGGKFVKLDLDDPDSPFGDTFADSMDPATSLENLGDALESVTYVGEEEVGGQQLRHYEATVDAAKLLASSGQDAAAAPGLPDTFDYDIWFDGEDRFTQLKLDMGKAGSTTMKLSDFGADVDIEAPDDSEITEDSPFSGLGTPSA